MSYELFLGLEFALAAVTFVALMFIVAPYGRHVRAGWGPSIPNRLGWILMEAPAVLLFLAIYLAGDHRAELIPLVFLGMWQLHYINRTFIFPFRLKSKKRMPLLIPMMAIGFNCLNAYVNARWISHLGDYADWFGWQLWVGSGVFLTGFAINQHSDHILLHLRKPGETGYVIPDGGMYRFISCPNYFGEILEWVGWAIATWSLGGLAFAVYTMANLIPRALHNHKWYQETFAEYPRRKAVIPGVL